MVQTPSTLVKSTFASRPPARLRPPPLARLISLTITYITVGTASTVDVYSNESDPNATQQGTRNILSYQTAWEMSGQIEPTAFGYRSI